MRGRDTSASAVLARRNADRTITELSALIRKDPDFVREDAEARARSAALQVELADGQQQQ